MPPISPGVGAGANDVVRIFGGCVQEQGWNGNKADQVENARTEQEDFRSGLIGTRLLAAGLAVIRWWTCHSPCCRGVAVGGRNRTGRHG